MSSSVSVSVIIPTKDRGKTLLRAINSVKNQTFGQIELIIVDDGSTDDTFDIVEAVSHQENFTLKYIKNDKSIGAAKCRNQGIDSSTGQYVAFLDSDDEWKKNHLELGIGLISSSDIDGVFGSYYVIEPNNKYKKTFKNKMADERMADYILGGMGDTRTSTFIFKSNPLKKVKFDSNLKKHQDWDLAICFNEFYKFQYNKNCTVLAYQDGKDRMSSTMNHEATAFFLNKHKDKISRYALSNFYYTLAVLTLFYEGKNQTFFKYIDEISKFKVSLKRRIQILMIEKLSISFVESLYNISNKFKTKGNL